MHEHYNNGIGFCFCPRSIHAISNYPARAQKKTNKHRPLGWCVTAESATNEEKCPAFQGSDPWYWILWKSVEQNVMISSVLLNSYMKLSLIQLYSS